MRAADAAIELSAMLAVEQDRRYAPGVAGASDAIAGRRRVEALELAIAALVPPAFLEPKRDDAAS